MRWRYWEGGFYPGFGEGFITAGAEPGPDPEGIRTVLLNYQVQASVRVLYLAIDPDGQEGDYFVVTRPNTEGIVRMRVSGDTTWTPVTSNAATTFKVLNGSGAFINVDIEVTMPTLDPPDPIEIPLELLYDLPQSQVVL